MQKHGERPYSRETTGNVSAAVAADNSRRVGHDFGPRPHRRTGAKRLQTDIGEKQKRTCSK